MTVKKYRESQKRYEQHILESIDLSGWSPKYDSAVTDKQRLSALYETFVSEYGWRWGQIGNRQNALQEWLMGIPSSINIEFMNYKILKQGVEFGALDADATEKQEDKFLEKYWPYMAMRIGQLWDRYNV